MLAKHLLKENLELKLKLQNEESDKTYIKLVHIYHMFPTGALHQKSKTCTIVKLFNSKYTWEPLIFALFLSLPRYKECILQVSFGHNPGQGSLWPIIVWY